MFFFLSPLLLYIEYLCRGNTTGREGESNKLVGESNELEPREVDRQRVPQVLAPSLRLGRGPDGGEQLIISYL